MIYYRRKAIPPWNGCCPAPRGQGLTEQLIRVREYSGFDSQAHLALLERQRQAFTDQGRRLDYLVK